MGTGWRRAFCTTVPRDRETDISDEASHSPNWSPRTCTKFGFFSGVSPSPRLHSQPVTVTSPNLRCRTINVSSPSPTPLIDESPKLQSKPTHRYSKSSIPFFGSNPSSPRSPLKLFRNSFRLRNTCGVCMQSVKSGQGMAIYTAECAHAFHFPCIAAHVRKQGALVCPICNKTWKDVPLLAAHNNLPLPESQNDEVVEAKKPCAPKRAEQKRESSPKQNYYHPQIIASDNTKLYDDEPLISPIACVKFVPIPETDENEEDEDVEEFQGFFVNPIASCSVESGDEELTNRRDSKNVDVKLMPEVAVVSVNLTHETYAVVLRVKAPSSAPLPLPPAQNNNSTPLLDLSRRAPIDLVTVLNVSGSMNGAKMVMLKRAMRLVISSLDSTDRLSIVAFSASCKRLMPLTRMTVQGQRSARRIIDRLVCSQGSSAVSDALRKATKVLEDRREKNPVETIILLSDGQDEQSHSHQTNQRQASANVSTTRYAHVEIPARSFGNGKKTGFSRHEPAEDAFTKCVGGLLSVVVQDLHIQLGFSSDSAPAEISAVYDCNGRPIIFSSGVIQLGDLYAEEERELLVELKVPTPGVGSCRFMSVRCSYKDPTTQDILNNKEQNIMVPALFSSRSSSPKNERLRFLFITTRAIVESRRLLEHNKFSSAHQLLASSRAILIQSNSGSADEYIRGLEAEIEELAWRIKQQQQLQDGLIQRRRTGENDNCEPLTPTSAWKAAEQLAKVAAKKKSMSRPVSDLHGFENARF